MNIHSGNRTRAASIRRFFTSAALVAGLLASGSLTQARPAAGALAAAPGATPRHGLPSQYVAVGDEVFFTTHQSPDRPGLWKSDGAATELLMEFPGYAPYDLAAANGLAFFPHCDVAHGCELWVSDGKPAGTRLFRDFASGPEDSTPLRLTGAGERLYMSIPQSDAKGLWVTDGTDEGTSNLTAGSAPIMFPPNYLTPAGDRLFFTMYTEDVGDELWVTEGTSATTRMVKDIVAGPAPAGISSLAAVGDTLYFRAGDAAHGYELWRSDGTEAGTLLVADIRPGPASGYPDALTPAGPGLFFTAYDGPEPAGLWYSDGTAAGTRRVWQKPGVSVISLMSLGSRAVFLTNGNELWLSDGTAAGMRLLRAFGGEAGGGPFDSLEWRGALYLSVWTAESGRELWRTDGTEAGTLLVADIRPGAESGYPRWLTAAGDRLFFTADDGAHGDEGWLSDGTAAGTRMFANLAPERALKVYLPLVAR